MKPCHRLADSTKNLDIVWVRHEPPDIIECRFSYEFCAKISKKLRHEGLNLASWIDLESGLGVESLLDRLSADLVLVVTNPELVLSPVAVKHLMQSLGEDEGVCVPVYNNASNPRQAAIMPAGYLNLSTYLEVAALVAEQLSPEVEKLSDPDTSCVLVRREVLESYHQPGLSIEELMSRISSVGTTVDRGALIHSFGQYYSGQREDLAKLVPASATRILDVGCARGGFGAVLRRWRPELELAGVEMNAVMAAVAAAHYDRIFSARVETVDFQERFDHINCGDIIEHLDDPWRMLKLFHSLLEKDGTLVISLPNAGHWTLVRDLARGEFPYLPVGLLCLTHIRWFTEISIREALEDAGFLLDIFHREQVPPTPEGTVFIDDLCRQGHGDRTSLLTNQFTLRAVKS